VLAGGSHGEEEAWEGSQGLSERIRQPGAGFSAGWGSPVRHAPGFVRKSGEV